MILIFEFGLILLLVLTGNSKVQLAQYFEVNNLKNIYIVCPPPKKNLMMTYKVVRRNMITYWQRSQQFPFD